MPSLPRSQRWLQNSVLAAGFLVQLGFTLANETPVPEMHKAAPAVQETGAFTFSGIEFGLVHFGPDGATAQSAVKRQPPPWWQRLIPAAGSSAPGLRGTWPVAGGEFELEQSLKPRDDGSFLFEATLTAQSPVPTKDLFLALDLPQARFAGQLVFYDGEVVRHLPYKGEAEVFLPKSTEHSVSVPFLDGGVMRLEGRLDTSFTDNRGRTKAGARTAWSLAEVASGKLPAEGDPEAPAYTLRVAPTSVVRGDGGRIQSATWSLRLRRVEPAHGTLMTGNPADGYHLPLVASAYNRPLWNTWVGTDENDGSLRIRTSQRDWRQFSRFRVQFEETPAKFIFTGEMKTKDIGGGGEPIDGARAQVMFLNAHGDETGGWPGGTVKKGSNPWAEFRQEHTPPKDARYADVLLGNHLSTGETHFRNLKLQAFDASGAPLTLLTAPNEERTDTAGWWTFQPGDKDESRPSIFDFSRLNHAPAGKLGFVQVRDGHFAYENGGRARFWGTGATTDFPASREEADRIAANLATWGVNLVRFHGLDAIFTEDGTTRNLDPEKLDRFGYYLAQLTKQGIYANINLNAYRPFTEGDGVKDAKQLTRGGGAATFFDRRLIDLQKEHATKLMNWVNPHTGLALKDDPAIAMIELKNETSLFMLDFMGGIPQSYLDDLDRLFSSWCERNQVARPEGHVRGLLHKRDLTAARFANEVLKNYSREMRDHLKSLGVRAPVSSTQFSSVLADVEAHGADDYVDRHPYWDTPSGGWGPTADFRNTSLAMTARRNATWYFGIARDRWIGKPFTVSEWNFCHPNEWIAEGPIMMAAFSGFQDWDAPMVFALGKAQWSDALGGCFDTDSHPHVAGPMKLAALAYLRGDVPPGPLLARTIPPEMFGADASKLFTNEELLTRRLAVGAEVDEKPTAPLPLRWGSEGFVVDTPRTQGYVGKAGQGVTCADIDFTSSMPFAQVVASSLDDEPLSTTSRFAISFAARAENTGQAFKAFRRGLVNVGTGPILIEPVKASVTLKRTDKPTVYVVDPHGRRTTETVPVVATEDGGWKLDLSDVKSLWVEVVYP